jgi:fructuronate reductase
MIHGVSLRTGHAEEELAPQDGLYTVAVREPGVEDSLQVIGAIASVGTGPAAALDALSAPAISLVTLTVTEGGYEIPSNEPADAEHASSAPALLALALARRRQDGVPPPVIASLDNLLGNGGVLRHAVLESAQKLDPTLPNWIANEVSFPDSVVDRMVPATTPAELDVIEAKLGLVDLAAVTTESHRSWVIGAVDGLPPLAEVGAMVVDDIRPYERRKLWLLNAPHSALAYSGLLAGCRTIADAAEHPDVAPFVRRLVDEILEVAELPENLKPASFALEALRRFTNPTLGHLCTQVGADGSRKLPQRLLPVVATRQERGLGTERFAIVAALWIASTSRIPLCGSPLPAVEDPAAERLRSTAACRDLHAVTHQALQGHSDADFMDEVAVILERLIAEGITVLKEPG